MKIKTLALASAFAVTATAAFAQAEETVQLPPVGDALNVVFTAAGPFVGIGLLSALADGDSTTSTTAQ